MNKKTSYDTGCKAKVALAAVRGEKTVAEIASEYNVASSLVRNGRQSLLVMQVMRLG